MIPLWQNATRAMHEQVVRAIESAAAAEPTEAQGALVAEARALAELVRIDGSWGVHNPRYTQQLLELAREKLRAAAGGAEASPPDAPEAEGPGDAAPATGGGGGS
jgi:hypothetical protein